MNPTVLPYMMIWFIEFIFLMIMALMGVAFVTIFERKILGLSQSRLGPNKVVMAGVLQPVLDGMKLLFKEVSFVTKSQKSFFFFIPPMTLFLFLLIWISIIPWDGNQTNKYASLMFLVLLGFGIYFIMLVGWSSLSSFTKIGSLRGMLQSLSFEVCLAMIILAVLCSMSEFSMLTEENMMLEFNWLWTILWLLMTLMETNRAPFDLLEGESELISGFNTEMSSSMFVFLFLGEYGMILIMAKLSTLASWGSMFSCFVFLVLVLRSCYPRMRHDVLMSLMWMSILPMVLFYFIMVESIS